MGGGGEGAGVIRVEQSWESLRGEKNVVIEGCDGDGERRAFFDRAFDGVDGRFASGLSRLRSFAPAAGDGGSVSSERRWTSSWSTV